MFNKTILALLLKENPDSPELEDTKKYCYNELISLLTEIISCKMCPNRKQGCIFSNDTGLIVLSGHKYELLLR